LRPELRVDGPPIHVPQIEEGVMLGKRLPEDRVILLRSVLRLLFTSLGLGGDPLAARAHRPRGARQEVDQAAIYCEAGLPAARGAGLRVPFEESMQLLAVISNTLRLSKWISASSP
jgi:hypothetical protein